MESPQQEKSPHQIGDRSLAGEVSPVQEKQAISQQPQSNTLPADKKPFSFLSNQAASGPGKNPAKQEPVTTSDALSVSIGLIFILLLIFSLAWFMRKMGYSNISGQGQLSILATLNLGQKEKIILLQVGQQQMLVGITATQINTLHVLKEPLESIETQAGKEVGNFDGNRGFMNLILNKKNTTAKCVSSIYHGQLCHLVWFGSYEFSIRTCHKTHLGNF